LIGPIFSARHAKVQVMGSGAIADLDAGAGVEQPAQPKALAFLSSGAPEAEEARERLIAKYGEVTPEDADCIVALGGDGLMLRTLHRFLGDGKPIYGMNRGSVGFLMNQYRESGLRKRIGAAKRSIIHPLLMHAVDRLGGEFRAHAINDVSLLRQTSQIAKLRIVVNEKEAMAELVADGVLISTPAGSTAYNLSAHGPILPLNAPLMALTPISAFRPRRWHGALLPDDAKVRLEVIEASKRPVSVVADHDEFRDVVSVEVEMDHQTELVLLHDPGHSLEERILREQFGY
jgi:NAD+ kinase